MTTLILMRHGETVSNIAQIYQGQGDGELSKKGGIQARAAAKYYSKFKIDSIFCSDLKRAYETAKIIGKFHKAKIVGLSDMRERFYGEWEGLKFNAIEKKFRRLYKTWLVDPEKAKIPGAETLRQLQNRGIRAIKKIVKNNFGKTVLVVGHGGVNRAILFYYLGLDLNNFWKIRQNNCCSNMIEFKKPYPKVVLMNCTSYLKDVKSKKNALN